MALELRKKGIRNVRPLAGGFFAWRDKGLPLESGGPADLTTGKSAR